MKYFYLVISINENGKQYAYVLRTPQCNNLKNTLDIKNLEFALLCETKKEAEKIATNWVENYKANKTYMFDYS